MTEGIDLVRMPAATPSKRLASLDTLRGVAILAVLVSHIVPGALTLRPALAEAALDLGRAGVTLFFLLSGYLIFRNVQSQPLPTFLCRRLFKVMPPYWGNILVILLLDLLPDQVLDIPLHAYLASGVALSDLLGTQAVSGVFWTLLIEIKFYVFIALQYRLLGRRHLHAVLAALLAFELAVWGWRGHGSLTLAYFPVFYLGIEISLAEAAGWSRRAMGRLAALTLVLAASLYLCLDQQAAGGAASLAAAAALFVLGLRRGFANRALAFLGLTSYSNYLYHSLVAGAVFTLLRPSLGPGWATAAMLAAFVVAVAVGALFYRLVEVPMVAMGRRLTRRPAPVAVEASPA